jgi:hypothetical protein
MDPNATLETILSLAAGISRTDGDNLPPSQEWNARTLAEHGDALDRWLTAGGFLPARWNGKLTLS